MSEEMPEEITGPYENWVFGEGAPYLAPPSPAEEASHVAAMAILAADAESPAGAPAEGGVRLLVPTLWRDGVRGDGVSFWPLLIDMTRDMSTRASGHLGAATTALRPKAKAEAEASASAKASATSGSGKPDEQEELGLRLNAALPRRSVDESFDPARLKGLFGAPKPDAPAAPNAILAVIDDGIAFAHRNLRHACGRKTRVVSCWLQSSSVHPQAERRTVLFGREYSGDEINEWIASHGHDETALYDACGAAPPTAFPGATIHRHGSHGSHVLDIAGGYRHGANEQHGVMTGDRQDLDDIAVIAVQLPEAATLDTTAFGKDACVLSAFHYIFDRAERLSQALGTGPLPLVINFSYGFSGGPHRGRERLERAIKALVDKRRETAATFLALPSGNTFHAALYGEISRAMLDARGTPDAGNFEIRWRVQPNDRTANYLELWAPAGCDFGNVTLRIADPHGRAITTGAVPDSGRHVKLTTPDGTVIGQLSTEDYGRDGTHHLTRLVIVIAPTEPHDPALPAAPAGLWRLELGGLGRILKAGPIQCRIQRDNDPFGYARGARQSYFDDPRDVRFAANGALSGTENPPDAFVRRLGTLSGLATHDAAAVVGGFTSRTGNPSDYSSVGALKAVDFSAGADNARLLRGVTAAGTHSGAVFRLSGTSVAAPQVARALVIALARGGFPANASAADVLAGRIDPPLPTTQPGTGLSDVTGLRIGRRLRAAWGEPAPVKVPSPGV